MRAAATVTTITITVAKNATSTVIISTASETLKKLIITGSKITSTVMEAITSPLTNKTRLVRKATAAVTTITIAVAKKTTSTVVTPTARLGKLHLLSEIVW